MKRFKAQKAYLVLMVILSVFINSSLVFGDSVNLVEAVSFKANDAGGGMTNQGVSTLANVISGSATDSTLVSGVHDTGATTETFSSIRPANEKMRIAKVHSGTGGCQESCSLY
jgi:hypothetical protein